jgi:hypothetical protein
MNSAGEPQTSEYMSETQTLRIEESKIVDYLLNPNHPIGRAKARFFGSKGFSVQDIEIFRVALRSHARTNKVSTKSNSSFGTKFVIDCFMEMPSGNSYCIRSVWIDHHDGQRPKLVTAHPLG